MGNLVRCVNLFTTQVDTVLDFSPQGPMSLCMSDSGSLYTLDSDAIHHTNILRITSLPRSEGMAADGIDTWHDLPEMAADYRDDQWRYQAVFSKDDRTRSNSVSNSSGEVYDANKGHMFDKIHKKRKQMRKEEQKMRKEEQKRKQMQKNDLDIEQDKEHKSAPLTTGESFRNRLEAYLEDLQQEPSSGGKEEKEGKEGKEEKGERRKKEDKNEKRKKDTEWQPKTGEKELKCTEESCSREKE